MNNKKIYIYIATALSAVLIIIGVIFFTGRNTEVPDGVTRYEWLEMLGERFGINEYTGETPYFSDVNSENPHFAYIQAAVEHNVLNVSSDFEGDKYASGQFIIVTAMKTLCEGKVRIYLHTNDAITDDNYIELGIEHGLIEKKDLKKGFSQEKCELVLETLYSLYFSEFWQDDYSNVVYQDGVTELSSTDILQCDTDGFKIAVTDSVLNSCEIGDVIVFEQKNTKLKLAREISAIGTDGTLSLKTVELSKVVDSLTVSDITELTFDDIINYYEPNKSTEAINNPTYRQKDAHMINAAILSGEVDSKGYKLSLSTQKKNGEKYLEIRITDNDTGEFYPLPIEEKINPDDEYSAEIDIDKMYIGGQIDFSWGRLRYAEAAVDAHATFSGNIKTEKEKKIRLFKTPVPLGNGVVSADIQIFIVLSVDGSISFSAELPVEVSVSYDENCGVRNFEHHIFVEKPNLEVNCSASAMLRTEPTLILFGCLDAIDVEADIGISASAQTLMHPNLQECADISAGFPVLTVSVCCDEDADTAVGKLDLSKEWEILTSENAPIQFGIHFELLPNGKMQFVDECTYKEETQENFIADNTQLSLEFSAYAQPVWLLINSPFEDMGEYYAVDGSLQLAYSVFCNDFDKLQIGDHFTISDREFVLREKLDKEEFPAGLYSIYCLNDGNLYYIQTKVSFDFGSSSGDEYYPICCSIPDYDFITESMEFLLDDLYTGNIKIAKDTRITSLMEISESVYTAKECFEEHILIDDWLDITTLTYVLDNGDEGYAYGEMAPPLFCYAILNKNGEVETIIYNSFV
ncbi:MAG: hypothetical protein NC313_11435 [Butyrivibrio sp.]|nr:hypothetical protein [Butyrivibrio sp.]